MSKIIYRHRISDNVYTIYKLSPYSNKAITEIEAGLAFNKNGGFSEELLKAVDTYQLTSRGTWVTANSYREFCSRLYLTHFFDGMSKNNKTGNLLHNNVLSECKLHYDLISEQLNKKNEKT